MTKRVAFVGFLVGCAALGAVGTAYGWWPFAPRAGSARSVCVGDRTYQVASVARTEAQREAGVNAVPLRAGQALVFDWPSKTRNGFWMRGVGYPLDIAWVDRGRVVDVATMRECASGRSCPVYVPNVDYTSAIETPTAGAGEGAFAVGDRVSSVCGEGVKGL